ncbi:YrdB family protein [Paenibacillus sp. SI8]|uniref:YrdB family protein n=1 Tax=unclassified Paenibacillus TaxID=185978 RepID=UPI0034658AEA
MVIIQNVLDAMCFILEITAFTVFGYWGYRVKASMPIKILLALSTPIIVIFAWGTFLAPHASISLPLWVSIILQLTVFVLAALCLYARKRKILAIIFISIAFCTTLLVYALQY